MRKSERSSLRSLRTSEILLLRAFNFLAEREEILRHKWLESERLGYDIGFERALLDWIRKHREGWRAARRVQTGAANQSNKPLASSGKAADTSPKSA